MALVQSIQTMTSDFVVNVAHLSAQTNPLARAYTAAKVSVGEPFSIFRLNLLAFGGDIPTIFGVIHVSRVPTGSTEEKILLVDACSNLRDLSLEDYRSTVAFPNSTATDQDAMYQQCLTIENGILQEGLYGSIVEFFGKARRLIVDRPSPDLNRSLLFMEERKDLHRQMSKLEFPFIRKNLWEASTAAQGSLSAIISNG